MEHKYIQEVNAKIWKEKKLIRKIYNNYYKIINNYLTNGTSLEIGSGSGNIKNIIKDCITSDLFNNNGIDSVQNIYNLKFENNSISNIIFLDVFHHIKYTGKAFLEISRVLKKNGKIVMIEPAMGILPRFIYYLFHKEPNGFDVDINLDENFNLSNLDNKYFAAQSIPWRLFYLKKNRYHLEKFNIRIEKVLPFSDFTYLLSGGYSYKSMYPHYFYKTLKIIDKILTIISKRFFAARMLIVLEKF